VSLEIKLASFNAPTMRHLLQPKVLNLAMPAALGSALACYPRMALWLNRSAPVWYLEPMIFFCSIVLWGFVFAWHTQYTNRPVWVLRPEPRLFIAATLVAIVVAALFDLLLDSSLRARLPEEYPPDFQHWLAQVLFSLFFSQLFLLFAPFAWCMRLFRNRWVAATLTVFFGVLLLALRAQTLATPLPPPLLTALAAGKIITGFLAIWFYLRGGILVIWWSTLLFESRHLLNFI
jgi:hypothetical protein